MFETLLTGSGSWNGWIWIIILLSGGITVYWIRSQGEGSYKENTGQTKPFLSGERAPSAEEGRLKSDNLYWGFLSALKNYFHPLQQFHTGQINDYFGWLTVTLAVILVTLTLL